MKKEFEELKEYSEKMLRSFSVNMLAEEKPFLELIDRLFVDDSLVDIDNAKKVIQTIEEYLKIKEKMLVEQGDFKFLKKFAEKLRKQKTRKIDIDNPPLFTIKNEIGENMYYLTRESAEEYCAVHTNAEIEMIHTNSFEIAKLLDILKRNFKNEKNDNW